jgi:hypothetical protein
MLVILFKTTHSLRLVTSFLSASFNADRQLSRELMSEDMMAIVKRVYFLTL